MEQLISGRWIAVSRWSGRVDLRGPLERVGGPEGFLEAGPSALLSAGFPQRMVTAMSEEPAEAWRGGFTHLGDAAYPEALLDLPKPPPALWSLGALSVGRAPAIAVVGARSCTPYGRSTARSVGAAIVQGGGAVISGAARGIDEAAHRGALDQRGRTLAVLGAGLAAGAAPAAKRLHQDILDGGGALLSEMPPMDPPSRFSFPRRNRIIAALSSATVVVEAAARSGALYTAEFAQLLQREVIAVPGRLDAPASEGTLRLIEEGATLLRSVSQMLGHVRAAERSTEGIAGRLQRALEQPGSALEVACRAGLEAGEATRLLSLMELTGVVRRLPDQRYVLT